MKHYHYLLLITVITGYHAYNDLLFVLREHKTDKAMKAEGLYPDSKRFQHYWNTRSHKEDCEYLQEYIRQKKFDLAWKYANYLSSCETITVIIQCIFVIVFSVILFLIYKDILFEYLK